MRLTGNIVASVSDANVTCLEPGLRPLTKDEVGGARDLALLVVLLVLVGQQRVLEAVEGHAVVAARALGAEGEGLGSLAV